MPKSRVIAILSLFVLSAILTACGNDNDDAESTVEPTATRAAITATATEPAAAATPADGQSPLATPTQQRVTPPSVARATPQSADVPAATPVATPSATAVVAVAPETSPVPASMPVQATFTLGGVEQQDYLITDEGCVGLGDWRGLKTGAQVIVRDASGTVVDVGELEAGVGGDECSWMADLSVPESEFVSISVPMIIDVWFSQADLGSGMVEIVLP